MPDASETVEGIMAVVAQDERERIARIKAALAEVKKRGEKKLGNPQGARPLLAWLKEHGYARRVGGTVERANRFALDVAPSFGTSKPPGL